MVLEELEETVNQEFSMPHAPSASSEHHMGEASTLNWWSQEEELNGNSGVANNTMVLDFDLSTPWLAPNV